jgi:putative ABC transport system permease protein
MNKLRTVLSLLGITIGIFAIISVLTVVSSLEKNIRDGIKSLGDDMVYVQKWPWAMGGEYPWWKYMKRPLPTMREMDFLAHRSEVAEDFAFVVSTRLQVKAGKSSLDGTAVMAVTEGWSNIRSFEIGSGRYFSDYEMQAGKRLVVIGSKVAEKLFPDTDPVGQQIVISGVKLTILGVFVQEGSSIIDTSMDNMCLLAVPTAAAFLNVKSENLNPFIMTKPKAGVPVELLESELQRNMRAYRKLKPIEEDDFAMNRTSMISNGLDGLFIMLNLAGWVIGGFSILVGGFGIANIMFVSVKEQTRTIGIQKALGAKTYFVLFQFLTESVMLSLFGGLLGLVIVWVLSVVVTKVSGFEISLTTKNVMVGLGISIFIGVFSGIFPANTAAKMDPVEAMAHS